MPGRWSSSRPNPVHSRGCTPKTGEHLAVDVPYALKINNGDAMREAAIAGFGVAALPAFIIHRAVKAGHLKVFLTEYERPVIALHAVYPSARHVPGRIRALIDFLVRRFGPAPPWDKDVFGETGKDSEGSQPQP